MGAHNGHNCSFGVEDPAEDHCILVEDHYNILEGDLEVDHSCTVELPEGVGSPAVDMFVFQNRETLFMGLWKKYTKLIAKLNRESVCRAAEKVHGE